MRKVKVYQLCRPFNEIKLKTETKQFPNIFQTVCFSENKKLKQPWSYFGQSHTESAAYVKVLSCCQPNICKQTGEKTNHITWQGCLLSCGWHRTWLAFGNCSGRWCHNRCVLYCTHDRCINVFANFVEITSLVVDIKIYRLCRQHNEMKLK